MFDESTVAGLARLAASRLTPDRTGGARSTEQSEATEVPPIGMTARDGAAPLSFGQERLWFLEQLEPGNLAYRLTSAMWITGRLDAGALARSLQEVVRRHESLRTTFSTAAGVAQQVVSGESGLELELEVERACAGADAREADVIIGQEVIRPFDLEIGPLIRARLIAFGRRRHLFVLCLHHIVTDGWSQSVLVRELTTLYETFRRDPQAPSPLPDLTI